MKLLLTQPTFLPWIGYFDLIEQSDLVVFLDDVKFEKQSWQQRNRIKSSKELQWITIAIKNKGKSNQLIKDVILDKKNNNFRKLSNKFYVNYNKSKYFEKYRDSFFGVLQEGLNNGNLLELNISIIKYILESLKISKKIFLSSEFNIEGKRVHKIVNTCKYFSCNEYISTIGAKDYLSVEKNLFKKNNIGVYLHNYKHPNYSQCSGKFIPYASTIDLLFNEGENSKNIIKNGRLKFFEF